MAKLFGRKKIGSKKKKKSSEKASEGGVSPLMADEPKSSSSSSRLKKDEQRESERKERAERRKKRDNRLEESKASKKSSSKSKKKSKPKLSQEEQDVKDANLTCCHKFQQFLVKLVHVIDALIGGTFVIYGSLIMTQFENPAMEAVITTLTFGSTMLFTSIMGVIGFYSRVCLRVGLVMSAYTAPFIAFFYIFVIIAMLASPGTYFTYLTEHKDVLYLDDAELLILHQLLPFFYIVLASLAAIEICRFLVLRNIRSTLLRFDAASKRISASHRSSKNSDRTGSNRSNITEPLLVDEEKGGVEDGDY